jgi:hypothetical protein
MMTDLEQKELDISSILDCYAYLDDQETDFTDWKLKDIINAIDRNSLREASQKYYDIINEAINAPKSDLGNFTLVSQSSIDADIPVTELYAVSFKSPNNDYYVAYRGTGDGKWVDNGEGMYKESSLMQRRAAEFFDSVVEKELLNENYRIILTGHSKGGNSAQYSTLASKYASLVDVCYSLDGQGFSAAAVELLKKQHGDNYQAQLDKMFSVNGENDYVHDLGLSVISDDRTFFVATPNGTNVGGMHDLVNMDCRGRN